MSQICKHCNNTNIDEAIFCGHCGKKLVTAEDIANKIRAEKRAEEERQKEQVRKAEEKKKSDAQKAAEKEKHDAIKYKTLGGWLYLVAYGLVVAHLVYLADISNFITDDIKAYFLILFQSNQFTWLNKITALLVVDVLGLFTLTLTTLHFFVRSRSTRILMMTYCSLSFILILISIAILQSIDAYESSIQTTMGLFSSVLWLFYFMISKRVEKTFVIEKSKVSNRIRVIVAFILPAFIIYQHYTLVDTQRENHLISQVETTILEPSDSVKLSSDTNKEITSPIDSSLMSGSNDEDNKQVETFEKKVSTTGILTVRSNVLNDEVFINGVSKGSTRLDLQLDSGKYDIRIVKDGFSTWERKVELKPEENLVVFAKLARHYEIEMLKVIGGKFNMGSNSIEAGRDLNESQHYVLIDDFKISRTEVRVQDFKRFTRETGYVTNAEEGYNVAGCFSIKKGEKASYIAGFNYKNPGFHQGKDHPVVCVSQNDAMAYIRWLNETTGRNFRLPTEAEQEYVIRAGVSTSYFWGLNKSSACQYANVAGYELLHNSFPCDDGYKYTAPVGSYKSNPFGIKDMIGNVWEWSCSEAKSSYDGSESQCSDTAITYVVRGGSWLDSPLATRAANRIFNKHYARFSNVGFRLAESIK